jgi:general secretion pathway protein D
MKRIGGVFTIFILLVLSAGCATESKDMAYMNRGFDELSNRNFQKAEEYLEKALSINPNNAYAILNIGVVYQNTQRPEKAREMYNKVIELESKSPASRSNKDWAIGGKLSDIAKKNLETL